MLKVIDELPDMVTHTGQKVYFNVPELTTISLDDIYYSASNICRYNGAIPWPLINHLELCVLIAIELEQLSPIHHKYPSGEQIRKIHHSFIHDFHEIYVGDMVSGLKKFCPQFTDIENSWEERVAQGLKIDISNKDHHFVKKVDLLALVNEMAYFGHFGLPFALEKHFKNEDVSRKYKHCISKILNNSFKEPDRIKRYNGYLTSSPVRYAL